MSGWTGTQMGTARLGGGDAVRKATEYRRALEGLGKDTAGDK